MGRHPLDLLLQDMPVRHTTVWTAVCSHRRWRLSLYMSIIDGRGHPAVAHRAAIRNTVVGRLHRWKPWHVPLRNLHPTILQVFLCRTWSWCRWRCRRYESAVVDWPRRETRW